MNSSVLSGSMISQAVLSYIQQTFPSLSFPARSIVYPNVPDVIPASKDVAVCQSFPSSFTSHIYSL